MVINGGLKDFQGCFTNQDLILFDNEIIVKKVANLPQRFAHTSHVRQNKLYQVGGVVLAEIDLILTIVDLTNFVVLQNFQSSEILSAPIVQHSSIFQDEKIIIFGGGTNCFSFGMHVNSHILQIDI